MNHIPTSDGLSDDLSFTTCTTSLSALSRANISCNVRDGRRGPRLLDNPSIQLPMTSAVVGNISPSDLDTCNPAPSKDAHKSDSELCDATLDVDVNFWSDANSSVCQMPSKTNSGSRLNPLSLRFLHQGSPNAPDIQTMERLDVAQCETIPNILKEELRRYKFIDSIQIWNNRLRVHVCLSMCEGKTNEEVEEMVKSLVETHGNIDKTDCDVILAESPVKLTFYNYPPSSGAKLNLQSLPDKHMTLGAYATTGDEGVVYLLSAGHGVSNESEDLFNVHLTNGQNITCVCRYLVKFGASGNFPWVDITALEACGLRIMGHCALNYVHLRGLYLLQVWKSDVKLLSGKVMYKIGATTGRTESVIKGRDFTQFSTGIENVVFLEHIYNNEIFCKPGDSGAIVRRKADDSAVLMIIGEADFSRSGGEKGIMAFKLCDGLDALKEMSGSEWRLLNHTNVKAE
ncbi:uncharacterized protein LOC106164211 [Lingula anatina]|uniref:Uncharacterized protein LOC106164211 n=1 Tax=Lingula anatina TaxID=7574 RepID=A0A1S3IJ13_LINAN|nr:uncharacterized protein LOC106164211 [Lingula anatina]|eukprot:XP_013397494.1 uncharacterized protein LOC106164211 [Lingula anatina]